MPLNVPVGRFVRPPALRRTLYRAREVYRYNASFRDYMWRPFAPVTAAARVMAGLAPRILFYPQLPPERGMLHQLCTLAGYRLTNDPDGVFDLAVKWNDTTFSPRDDRLARLAERRRVINIGCEDISKARVGAVSAAVLGYTATVDPEVHTGRCVVKSNINARHDGRVVECPVSSREADCVYQRIINNEIGGGLVEDIRIPVFGPGIPFAYLKYRPVTDRFSPSTNVRVALAEVPDVFTPDEVEKILRLCARMGLDYGELDVLRDRDDRRVYVVDVNATPWGPPKPLSEAEKKIAIVRMAAAFRHTFLGAGASRPGGLPGLSASPEVAGAPL